jgi:CheY-like chemotaxis protein
MQGFLRPLCRILSVEDHEALLAQLRDLFRIEGYAVTAAPDGLEALRLLDGGEEPDGILRDLSLDLYMDGVSGWDGAAELRQDGRAPPIVVMTADPDPARCAAQVHAVATVAKPLDLRRLVGVVARAMRQASRGRQIA